VLIANRGEIANRIAAAAAALGIDSVAVYPPLDSRSLHLRTATRAVRLPSRDDGVAAYLDADALIAAAREADCDAVHPGYGFLSESPAFAQRCADAGLVFVGPTPHTLAIFGDKVSARNLAVQEGVPVIPGSDGIATLDDALSAARSIGYPVMMKAAAGGGGRGMRVVTSAADMEEAFTRCRSEAQAAFGDGSLFMERYLVRPRHVEVQVLGDGSGSVVHLHERDCSVQVRHQKVLEIAPAAGLDETLRERILTDAVRLAAAARLSNAATIEFLVLPESGEHFFIEGNARIQVEHTVTEQVTGIDLVQAQFRLAGGASLGSLGLGEQAQVPAPRGFAVQARVVARGSGTFNGYREPTGVGVRVDSNAYAGYAPPPVFDPLFAKVIGQGTTLGAAVDRTLRALAEYHVSGVPTNIAELRAYLAVPAVRAGDARTTLVDETSVAASAPASDIVRFLDEHASGSSASSAPTAPSVEWDHADGDEVVRAPMASTLLDLRVSVGDVVTVGGVLAVVSAMKMETTLTAPCSGVVERITAVDVGSALAAGEPIVLVRPAEVSSETAGASPSTRPRSETWEPMLEAADALRSMAHARMAPGSTDPGVVRQRNRGKLTCRERIAELLDEGSFREVGSVAGFISYDENGEIAEFTPANHVGGTGTIEGRSVIVCADDFTSRGGHSDGAIGTKSTHLDRLSIELRIPSIRLLDGSSGGGSVATMVPQQRKSGEATAQESEGAIQAGKPRVSGSGGSFLPGHLGSTMYTEQLSSVPVVNVLMGSVVGLGAAKAVLGHFSVMIRDTAQLFVAGPPVVRHAVGYEVTKEDLGGWHIHCRNGSVDNLAESEEDALAQTRRFLSYLPPSVDEAPPTVPHSPGDDRSRRNEELLTIIPRKRTTTFDIRRLISLLADKDSFFEIGPLWGTDQITALARFEGRTVGILASDSRHPNGGAMTADGCSKLIRHLDVCDLFHIPILNLVDNPGFAVGIEHETASTIRRGGEWMVAFSQVKVPLCTVVLRRSFGVAGNNYATPRDEPSVRYVWPAADMGGIPPEGGIEAAYKRQLAEAEDPEAFRAELMARIESARGPLGPLSKFQVEEMIDPRDTRQLVCEWLDLAYRIVSRPTRLGPRALQFRP